MEVIRQAILDTFEYLRPDHHRLPETQSVEVGARARSGIEFVVTRVSLDYRGEGFLTDYQFQGREYRAFWPMAQRG